VNVMPEKIARTGRVQNWLDNPESRLPVSCTVFEVQDSMEGPDGIEASWLFTSYALRYGAGVAIHLSKIRPENTGNGRGLISSGPISFAEEYHLKNKILRRGGIYKNGAVVLHMDLDHPDILQLIDAPRTWCPWAKRCINLNQQMWDDAAPDLQESLVSAIARGDVWLAKIRYDQHGQRIFANVCLEVFLRSRGTCLLEHIALGACEVNEIGDVFEAGMKELIELHARTGVGESREYLPPDQDRQVGLGMLGLANLLSLEDVKYAEFADALDSITKGKEFKSLSPRALSIGYALKDGIARAAKVAKEANMDRAFAIAPTASCSYRYTDRKGFTTTPEIAPPINRVVDRDSGTFGVQQVNYGNVETCDEVGWDNYVRVANGIMQMLQDTGLSHGYSFNTWSDHVCYNNEFIEEWLDSPQTSMYYSLQVRRNTQAKDDAMVALGDEAGDFSIFGFDDIDADDNDPAIDWIQNQGCVGCAE